ncbi:hypothetical protein YIM73052_24220 [Thermus antranikianii]
MGLRCKTLRHTLERVLGSHLEGGWKIQDWGRKPAHPHAGVRGVWVREGEAAPEIERVKGFKPLPKRWVVERTFAWLGRNRQLGKDYEFHPEVSEAWIYEAWIYVVGMISLLVKRLVRAA